MSLKIVIRDVAAAIIICSGVSVSAHAAPSCAALSKQTIPAGAIGLPTRGAIIESARPFPAEKDLPATCRVVGRIVAHTKNAPPIRFQLNLPGQWNGKALQLGGGGLDGVLVEGLHDMPGSAAASQPVPNPLARGYATFGSDGGHQAANPMDASFGRNPEARANYVGEAVKRTHDAALFLMRRFYGAAPRRMYFAGGSKGGHEGLVAAQRYGSDYDGVVAYYPAKDSVALNFGWGALSEAAYGPNGGALSTSTQELLKRRSLDACDKLDGLQDGVIANTRACEAAIGPVSLLCGPRSTEQGKCLSPREVAMLERALRRTWLPYPVANGVSSIGPFPVMQAAPLDRTWLSEKGRGATVYEGFVNGIIRNFWTHDDRSTFANTDMSKYRDQILAHSAQSDATSTDLDIFSAHGGKLILVQGSVDMLVPPDATIDYFRKLTARYGERTSGIAKLFVQPGYSHGFGDFDLSWDSLAALDAWVEQDIFPTSPIATDGNAATRDRQMPLCNYPAFPRFIGGNAKAATSFRCVTA